MRENGQVTLVIGADHGGYTFAMPLIQKLEGEGYSVVSVGAESLNPEDDYPKFAFEVGKTVAALQEQGKTAFGVLLCRSGAGMTIAANKVKGIRAATATSSDQVIHARQHNNANVLALSSEWSSQELIWQLTDEFITTPFSGEERHERRIAQITEYESA